MSIEKSALKKTRFPFPKAGRSGILANYFFLLVGERISQSTTRLATMKMEE